LKLFGNIRELVKVIFREDGQEISLDANSATTYTADRAAMLPPGDVDSTLVGEANTQALTNKTIDGDLNTVQDLPVTALKTVLGDADKVILRDASGVPLSAKIVNANVDAAAAIDATKIGNGDVTNTELSYIAGLTAAPISAASTDTLTNKTIDGDDNTIQDLALTSIKTVLADANKVLRRDASGVPVSDNALPNSSAIVTIDAAQVITAKDIDGGTASNTSRITLPKDTLANLQALTRKEATLVFDTTSKQVYKDDGTTLALMGSGSGSGETNYIENTSADTDLTGWVASGAGITVTRTTTAANLPREPLHDAAILITPVSGTTDYVRYRFTLGDADKSKLLKLQWAQKALSGYAAGDLVAEMWTNAASNYGGAYTQLSIDNPSIPASDFVNLMTFASTSADYYELRIRRAAGTTALALQDVLVGPGTLMSVPAISDTQLDNALVSASAGFGTIANKSIYKKRVGDRLILEGYFTAGTVAGTTAFISLNGLTVDTDKLPKSGGALSVAEVGQFVALAPGGPNPIYSGDYAGKLFMDTDAPSQEIRFTTVINSEEYQNQAGSSIIGNGQGLYFRVDVPIAEWASDVFIDTSRVEFAASTAGTWDAAASAGDTVYGLDGAPITGALSAQRSKDVQLRTQILPTDIFAVQYKIDEAWVNAENSLYPPTIHGAGVNFGLAITNVNTSTNVVTVTAYQYISPGATYNGSGVAYDGTDPQPTAWRIIKSSNPIGIGQSAITAEYSVPVSLFEIASATYEDVAVSPALPRGTYLCSFQLTLDNSVGGGIASPFLLDIVVDTAVGNSTSAPNSGINFCARTATNGTNASSYYTAAISGIIVTSDGANLTINGQAFTGNVLRGKSYASVVSGSGTNVSGMLSIVKIS
jgi:hypothetical protein